MQRDAIGRYTACPLLLTSLTPHQATSGPRRHALPTQHDWRGACAARLWPSAADATSATWPSRPPRHTSLGGALRGLATRPLPAQRHQRPRHTAYRPLPHQHAQRRPLAPPLPTGLRPPSVSLTTSLALSPGGGTLRAPIHGWGTAFTTLFERCTKLFTPLCMSTLTRSRLTSRG